MDGHEPHALERLLRREEGCPRGHEMEHTGLEASERTMRPVCQELRNERHELTFSYPWSEGETQKSGTWPSLFRTCSLPGPPSVGPRDPRGSSGSDAACPETAPRPAIPGAETECSPVF